MKNYCAACHFELKETENQYCSKCTEELEQMIMDQYRAWEREKQSQTHEPKPETPGDALEAMEAWEYSVDRQLTYGEQRGDIQMTTNTPYHKWLIRMRIYCEHKRCMKPAERVRNINGRDTVLCSWHAKTRRQKCAA